MTPLVALVYLFITSPPLVNAISFHRRSISTNFEPHSTYLGENGHTCYVCRPGFHFVGDCTSNLTTAVCKECNSGTYNTNFNIASRCATCTDGCIDKNAEVMSPCNATADAKCQCKDGYYNHSTGPNEWKCLPHTKCEPGKEPYRQGTPHLDTICHKCEKGYFSPSTSLTERCTACSSCGTDQDTSFNCNETVDTVCVSKDKGQQEFLKILLPIVLLVPAAVATLALVVFLRRNGLFCRQDNRQNDNTEENKDSIVPCVEPQDFPFGTILMTAKHLESKAYQTEIRHHSTSDPNATRRDDWRQLFPVLLYKWPNDKWMFFLRTLLGKFYKTVSEVENKLATIRHDYRDDLKEQKYQSLISWLQLADDACLEDIIYALEQNEITDLDNELKERFPSLLRNPGCSKVQPPQITDV